MQRHLIAALAASVVLLPSFAFAETKTLDVAQFHAVDVSSGIRAIVSGGKPLSVVADAKEAKDIELDETAHIMADEVALLEKESRLAHDVLPRQAFTKPISVAASASSAPPAPASSGSDH